MHHTVADSPPRPRLRFNFFIFDNMFSLTYGASPAVLLLLLLLLLLLEGYVVAKIKTVTGFVHMHGTYNM